MERQAPEAKARLEQFARDYAERQAKLDEQVIQLRDERDEAVREAYREDMPMKAIAAVMSMSHQRVSQIVRS